MARDDRFYLLDGIRGVAAIAVMAYHLGMRFDLGLFRSGAPVVDLFFALSGFVIARNYGVRLAAGMSVRRFMASRFIRLQPLALFGVLLGSLDTAGRIAAGDAVAISPVALSLGVLLNGLILPLPVGSALMFPLNSTLWSLFAELIVNIAFAIWMFSASTRVLLALMVASFATLVAVTFRMGYLPAGEWIYLPGILARATFGFVTGILFARSDLPRRTPSRSVPVGLLLATLVVTIPNVGQAWQATYDLAAIPLLLLLLRVALQWEAQGRLLALCRLLGELSYPVYIIHFPLLGIGWKMAERYGVGPWTFAIVYFPAVLAMAAVLVRFYDQPLRERASAWLRLHRPGLAQSGSVPRQL